MTNSAEDRRKKIHRTGALGMVLAQAEAKANAPLPAAVADPSPSDRPVGTPVAARTPHRFFPTKGFGRVPANVCRPWSFADRPSDEFGHLQSLARSIERNGQVQPALVRVCSDADAPQIRYEVIAGVARWRSALSVGGELDIQIRELTDGQAYRAMVAENEDRQNLSDYARAKRFLSALELGLVSSKTELAEIAHVSASQMSYLLGFASLPADVLSAISDLKAMPVRLGYVLSVAVREGFTSELIRDMPRIESGEIPRDAIPDVWRESAQDSQGTDTVRAERLPKKVPKIYNDKSGTEICRVYASADGAVTLKLAPHAGSRLSTSKVAKIVELLEAD